MKRMYKLSKKTDN